MLCFNKDIFLIRLNFYKQYPIKLVEKLVKRFLSSEMSFINRDSGKFKIKDNIIQK